MGDMRDDFDALKAHQEQEKQMKIARFYEKALPAIKEMIKKYDDVLVLEEKSSNHFQIKNLDTRKFINFWHTRAMQRLDGSTCGLGYKEENIRKEIERLVHEE